MTNEELKQLYENLWTAADQMRANSDLKSSEYATPVLGIIFLKFADNRYSLAEAEIQKAYKASKGGRRVRKLSDIAIEKCGFFLPDEARYENLLQLPGSADHGKAIKSAMQAIEKYKPELEDTLPKDEYFRLTRNDKSFPGRLLKIFSDIPTDATGDLFGKIYEYFLAKFALAEGQGGGEFFTPTSVVQLIVEFIEPYTGKIYDPASGSGGMFVQSAHFVERRRAELRDQSADPLVAYGQEKTLDSVKLARMNLAVNGIDGDIRQANTYLEDPHESFQKFDYVMANPPFNVDEVAVASVKDQERFNHYGIPRNKSKAGKKQKGTETVPNANYLWINLFASSLNDRGRAGFVMANSASDARHSEAEIREKMIEDDVIEAMLTLPSNMFFTVTLPATLWFLNRDKPEEHKDRILFIDARNIFRQIDRAHREFTPAQIQNLATILRLHHGERERYLALIDDYFAAALSESTAFSKALQELESVCADSKKRISTWFKKRASDFSKSQTKTAAEFDYQAKLQGLQLAKSEKIATGLATIEKELQAYRKQFKPKKIEAANALQLEFSARCADYEESLKVFRKSYDQDLRALDGLYRLINKELREKDDDEFKKIPPPKNLQAAFDEFSRQKTIYSEAIAHARWMQERFPEARYEDVTGLCKLADQNEIAEQDFSLNPGRYVGVVIEEDGLTEDEFREEMQRLHRELAELGDEARGLEEVIVPNFRELMESI